MDFSGKLDSGHVGHRHVRNDHIISSRLCAKSLERLDAASPGGNGVAKILNHIPSNLSKYFLIVNEEDMFFSSGDRLYRLGFHSSAGFNLWQINLEGRSYPRLTINIDCPAIAFHNPVHH